MKKQCRAFTGAKRPSAIMVVAMFLCCGWSVGPAAVKASPAPPPAVTPTFPHGMLEGVPGPLTPKRQQTEAERDRLEATRLFAAGRAHEQRQEYRQALRMYERALWYDPGVNTIAQSVVWLAYHQKQDDVAIRYLKMCDPADDDPALLHRLSMHLLDKEIPEKEDIVAAAALLERAIVAQGGAKEDAGIILVRMELGRLYHILEQHKKAADNFAHVLPALEHPERFDFGEAEKTFLGKPAATYDMIGESLLLADRLPEATAAFEKGNAKAPNSGLLQYNLARVSARAGKPEEALDRLDKAFQLHWNLETDGPYELLAEVLKKLGKEQELLPRLEKLYTARPADVPLGYFLAGQYRQAKQLDKAESLYSTLLKKAPAIEGSHALIELYRKAKRADALLEVLGAEAARTGRLESLGSEGKSISEDAALMRQIVDAARQRLSKGPDKLDYGMKVAVALLALEGKQYAVAAEFFDLAIAARPKQAGELLLVWGIELLLDERAAEAVKVFQRGIDQKALSPDNPAFFFYLAGALSMCDRTNEALAAARKAAEIKKNSPLYCSRAPWILQRAKRYDEAIAAYSQLVARFDANYDSADVREIVRDARLSLSALCVERSGLPRPRSGCNKCWTSFPMTRGPSTTWATSGPMRINASIGP